LFMSRAKSSTRISSSAMSVIIPTLNRADLLASALASLEKQTLAKARFEVIVVDDGSTDGTEAVCRRFARRLRLKYLRQSHRGIAAAKNAGIRSANGEVLFFFDDDDVADPNLLRQHLATHQRHPDPEVAVLGYTDWHGSLEISEVMRFLVGFQGLL